MRIHDAADEIQSPTELFINAINTQARHSGALPFVLNYAPVASMNPFQRLLYSGAARAGFAVVPTLKFENLGQANWQGRSIIHLHWLASVLKGSTTEHEAKERLKIFSHNLGFWKDNGHKIVWTMHNLMPHNTINTEAELELRKIIVKSADAVHLLSKDSLEVARPFFSIPENKIFYIPHPSYEGWYANLNDPVAAKLDLGIAPNEFVFCQFGAMQPYKGTLDLIHSYKELEARMPMRRFRLIIAGKPSDKAYVSEIRALVNVSRTITLIPSPIEEREVQTIFNAADIIVAPYVATLNSGIALLAATFKKGLVAPCAAGIRETFFEDETLLYSGKQQDRLTDALLRSVSHKIQPSVFKNILAKHNPNKNSDAFFTILKKLLSKQKNR